MHLHSSVVAVSLAFLAASAPLWLTTRLSFDAREDRAKMASFCTEGRTIGEKSHFPTVLDCTV